MRCSYLRPNVHQLDVVLQKLEDRVEVGKVLATEQRKHLGGLERRSLVTAIHLTGHDTIGRQEQ